MSCDNFARGCSVGVESEILNYRAIATKHMMGSSSKGSGYELKCGMQIRGTHLETSATARLSMGNSTKAGTLLATVKMSGGLAKIARV